MLSPFLILDIFPIMKLRLILLPGILQSVRVLRPSLLSIPHACEMWGLLPSSFSPLPRLKKYVPTPTNLIKASSTVSLDENIPFTYRLISHYFQRKI
jgi:hypothetical protein